MASAKKEAQSRLGKVNDYINLKGLNQERSLANDVYNTNTASFQNAYNDLLDTINTNRTSAKRDFNKGRATVSENAYLQNRNDISDLASRGLNGGLQQLSKLGNRMETGRQFSNLANTYYNTMNELDANERTYTNNYNTNMETARNTLNATLADIDAREKANRNAYKAAVAQLAEQIQARRDANAAASAALKVQKDAYKQQGLTELRKALSGKTWGEASDYLVQNGFFKNTKQANDFLRTQTTIRPQEGVMATPTGYKTKPTKTTLTQQINSVAKAPITSGPSANLLQNYLSSKISSLWR